MLFRGPFPGPGATARPLPGIPCVVVFNEKSTAHHETLMAGELFPVSRLLKRVYRSTKGKELRTDGEGFFVRAGAAAPR